LAETSENRHMWGRGCKIAKKIKRHMIFEVPQMHRKPEIFL